MWSFVFYSSDLLCEMATKIEIDVVFHNSKSDLAVQNSETTLQGSETCN